ncbi:hypothetical protein MNBD_NITROSPINAE04-2419 [hydrothermal vent metagenome]|uniref:BON domain-containing protein n=1 Tax=hydrothermal vent metagenome TaxID=652676 RepID=A0A3B1D8R7_9ZZZZ
MRLLIIFIFAAFVFTGPAYGEGKGVMEKAGETIDRGIENTKDFFSDSAITTRVKTRLLKDDYVSGFDIKISTKDGVCSVKGEVESEKLARRVMGITRSTKGVKSAKNHLVVVKRSRSAVK